MVHPKARWFAWNENLDGSMLSIAFYKYVHTAFLVRVDVQEIQKNDR